MSDIYKNKENILIVVIVSILISLRFLFMEDITFINDEPWFLGFGLDILETKKFLTLGLEGKMGVKYGPYTAWFYGLLLSISKNLLTIAYLKTGIISFFTLVAGIVGIRSQKNLSYWLLIPLFSSLYLFNYSRLLWDLEISTTFLAVSFYLSFLKDEKKIKIYIALLTCVFATLTHLMSLPTALALGIHFLIFKRQWIKNNLIAFFGLLLLFLSVGGPYYYYVLTTPRIERVAFDPDFRCFFYSFFGARFLTTFDFSYFLGKNWQFIEGTPQVINHIILYLSALTWLPYPVSFFGLYLSI
ncbi:MAG: hypothetical protein HN576_03690, partial [Bacteriovoracaceae bacterium]|nr:hypothetical protein [Bacteriovoracaceae bacterium]